MPRVRLPMRSFCEGGCRGSIERSNPGSWGWYAPQGNVPGRNPQFEEALDMRRRSRRSDRRSLETRLAALDARIFGSPATPRFDRSPRSGGSRMVRIFGFTGSRRRRRYQLAAIFSVTVLLAGFAALPAQAVHDEGVFELEGNAVNDPGPGDDWDNVCHQVTITEDTGGTIPDQCATAGDTTGASALSWAEELDRNASIFTGGGSKDQQNVSAWAWKDGAGGLPDKDNLLHGFAARYSSTSCPAGSPTPCDLLYFGSDRFDNSGA